MRKSITKLLSRVILLFLLILPFVGNSQVVLGINCRANPPLSSDCGDINVAGGTAPGSPVVFCEGELVTLVNNTPASDVDTTLYCWGDGYTTVVAGNAPASHVYGFRPDTCITTNTNATFFIYIVGIKRCGTTTRSINWVQTPIAIRLKPRVAITSRDTICVGSEVRARLDTICPNARNATYTWSYGDGRPNSTQTTSNGSNLASVGGAPRYDSIGRFNIRLGITNSCGTAWDSGYVVVLDSPRISFNVTANNAGSCIPFDVTFNNTSRNINSQRWTVTGNTNFSFINGTNRDSRNPSIRFTAVGNYTVNITGSGCRNATKDTIIRTNTIPTLTMANIIDSCVAVTVNPSSLVSYGGGTPTSYQWTFVGGNPAASTLRFPASQRYTTPGNYSVTAAATNVCGTATQTRNFSVTPTPTVAVSPSNAGSCIPFDVTFTNNTPLANAYTWNITGSAGASFINSTNSTSSSPTVRFSQIGTYTVRVTSRSCAAFSYDTTIRTNDLPTVALAPIPDSCVSNTVQPANLVTYGGGTPTSYQWTFVGSSGSSVFSNVRLPSTQVYNTAGNYEMRVQVSNVCGTRDASRTFRVTPLPNVGSISSSASGCLPLNVTFNNTGQNSDNYRWSVVGGTAFTYTNGTSATVASPQMQFTQLGTYGIRVNSASCPRFSWDTTVTTNTAPTVALAPITDSCVSNTVDPSRIVTYGGGTPSTYSWTFANSTTPFSNQRTPAIQYYTTAGAYSISVTTTNGCGTNTASRNFNVTPIPSMNVASNSTGACLPLNVDFNTQSVGTNNFAWTVTGATAGFAYTGGTNNASQSPRINFTELGTYNVRVTSSTCRQFSWDTTITTNVAPTVALAPIPDSCVSNTVDPSRLVTYGVANNLTYGWTFSGQSSPFSAQRTPSVQRYTSAGTYNVSVTVTNGCGTVSADRTFRVTAVPATSTVSSSSGGCLPLNVSLNTQSQGTDNFNWVVTGGNGFSFTGGTTNTSQNPRLTFTELGTYGIRVTAQNCRQFSWDTTVTTNIAPTVALAPIADSCMTHTLDPSTIVTYGVANNLTYNWTFAGSSSPFSTQRVPGIQSYTTAGNYTVSVTATNACGTATADRSFRVTATPSVSVNSSSGSGCLPFDMTTNTQAQGTDNFTWTVTGGTGYAYTNGTTNISQSPSLRFTGLGTYNIRAISQNCRQFAWDTTITTNAPPTVDLARVNDSCVTNTVDPARIVTYGGGTITNYSWTFVGGATPFANVRTPSVQRFTQTGNYSIRVEVANGCGVARDTTDFRVTPLPTMRVAPSSGSGCLPLNVNFETQTQNVDTYTWNVTGASSGYAFTNGTTSLSQNPTITFTQLGSYRVRVVGAGCSLFAWDTTIVTDILPTVRLAPVSDSCVSNTVDPAQIVSYGGGNIGAYSWVFDGGTAPFSNERIPSVQRYTQAGNYSIIVAASNGCGTARDTIRFRVHGIPNIRTAPTSVSGCLPLNVTFANDYQGIDAFTWEVSGATGHAFINGTNANSVSPTVQFTQIGTFRVAARAQTCRQFAWDTTIITNTFPTVSLADVQDSCLSHTIDPAQLVTYGGGTPSSYAWVFSGLTSPFSSERTPAVQRYTTPGNYNVQVSAINGCGIARDTIFFRVTPMPAIAMAATSLSGCIPLDVNFNNSGSGDDNFNWSIVGNSAGFAYTNGTTSASGSPRVRFTQVGTYGVRVTAQSCRQFSWDSTIVTSTNPLVSLASVQDSCQTNTIDPSQIVTYTGGIPNTYRWTFVGGDPTISTARTPSVQRYTQAGNYNIQVEVENGCGIARDTIHFRVIPLANIAITQVNTVCNTSSPIQLSALPLGGAWVGSGVTNTGILDPAQMPLGRNRVAYSVGEGRCRSEDSTDIFIGGTNVNAGGNLTICANEPRFDLAGFNPTGGIWSGAGVIDSLIGTFNPSLAGAGRHRVTYTVTQATTNCSNTAFREILVHPAPVAGIDTLPDNCANRPIRFLNRSNSIISATWAFGDGGTSNQISPNYTYLSPGQYAVTLTVANAQGCSNTTVRNIVVDRPGVADFVKNTNGGCGPEITARFVNTSVGTRMTYSWVFGNGQVDTSTNPPVMLFTQGMNDTTYRVSLVATNFCGTTIKTDSIRVRPKPRMDFGFQNDGACSPMTVRFANVSTGEPTTYIWDLGNGVRSTDSLVGDQVYRTDTVPRVYNVTLIGINVCGTDTARKQITVLPANVRAFFSVPNIRDCQPMVVRATNFSTPGARIWWEISDGNRSSVQDTLVYRFVNAGTYTIRQFANNGCGYDSITRTITVLPSPRVGFRHTPTACINQPISFYDSSATRVNTFWRFGDGDSSLLQNPPHIYQRSGIYDVTLVGTDPASGCRATATSQVTVRELPIAGFIPNPMRGCVPMTVRFGNTSTAGANFFSWNFSNLGVSNQRNPTFTFDSVGVYNVNLRVVDSFGCYHDTIFRGLTVHPSPTADFDMQSSGARCAMPVSVRMLNRSVGASSYGWFFGNTETSTASNPSVTYRSQGDYTISLIAINAFGCRDTAERTFQAAAQPTAEFSIRPQRGCAPLTVTFENRATNMTDFLWDFGDGRTDTTRLANFTHRYDSVGTFTPTLIVGNRGICFDTLRLPAAVFVKPVPIADFMFTEQGGQNATGVLLFNNRSQFATTYTWDFGTGGTSTDANPIHRFPTNGVRNIRLIARDDVGCSDTMTKSIVPNYFTGLFVPNAFAPDNGVGEQRVFMAKGTGMRNYRINVYSSYGKLVWTSNALTPEGEPSESWNGKEMNTGEALPQDAYVWEVEDILFLDGTRRNKMVGTVMLLR